MTRPPRRGIAGVRLPAAVQRLGATAAALALGGLAVLGPQAGVPVATAAGGSGLDQITGSGLTASAVTATWQDGLLDDNNQPISGSPAGELASDADRAAGTGPLSFMYDDFSSLKVTVSQTTNITNQGITVSWTGEQPTEVTGNGAPESGYLQLMECYGDAADGPDPTQCEYGSAGLLAPGIGLTAGIGTRTGDLCAPGAVASPPAAGATGGGVAAADGSSALAGCDPQEPGSSSPPDIAPCTGAGCPATPTGFSIPFVPVNDPTDPVYGAQVSQDFDEFTTNEVQAAVSDASGSGQQQFETLTSTQAPGLGCGQQESDGQPQGCWLVIVPRGTSEPNGFKVTPGSVTQAGSLNSSPLSASNWAMRIQVHLGYAPLGFFCPIGTQERLTVGTQVMTDAMDSWELALNQQANCSRIYGFSAVPESTSTTQLCDPAGSTIGLAFTTVPIGSEAARDDGLTGCANPPPMLYAPVAVTALGLGFNINDGKGRITTVKMSPILLAKALTQAYRDDLPDVYTPDNLPGPSWAASNPASMSNDPQFQQLNDNQIPPFTFSSESTAPLLTEDHSQLNEQVWQWIQADPGSVAWLDKGTLAAGNTVAVDPDYEPLQLGKPQLGTAGATDSFPRAYSGVLDLKPMTGDNTTDKDVQRDSLDLLTPATSYITAAAQILTADNPALGNFDSQAIAPDGTDGWFDPAGVQPLGKIFMWGIADTPDLASFGLADAQLCTDSGGGCVAPTAASVSAALAAAKPDSAGLLQVNPASPGPGGYPLVQVIYAAVPTNQGAAALTAYADLIAFAAGTGQTAGTEPGNLPPGYLPLTSALQARAMTVAAKLRADAAGNAGGKAIARSPNRGSGSGGTAIGGGATTLPAGPAPAPAASLPAATSSPSPPEFTISRASPQLAAATTERQVVGAIRWALLVVVIAGAACAISGAVLRTARVPAWLQRMRT